MSIFQQTCYRKIIYHQAKAIKTTHRKIAQSTGVHTSYFSRVMQEGADFSEEQLFAIGKHLNLKPSELEYFILLGTQSRSGSHQHKKYLEDRLQRIKAKNTKVIDELENVHQDLTEGDIAVYYEEAITAKIHMLLTIAKFRFNLALLEKKLRITKQHLHRELQKLHQLKIIMLKDDEVTLLKKSIHLDHEHPSSMRNHKNWRIETLYRLGSGEKLPSDYHLSATFSCDEKTKTKIKDILKNAVVASQKEVSQSKSTDDVFHIGIDLY